jgi:uncharacterized membrane protein
MNANGEDAPPSAGGGRVAVNSTETGRKGGRIAAIDALRGLAIAAMVVYHFSWDLYDFQLTSVDVINEPLWKAFARTIAGTFVALVGVSLVLATRNGLRVGHFLRRLAIIVGAAILVTIGTKFVFPDAYVFFGILHLIAFASVAALPFLYLPLPVVLLAAVAVFVLPFFYSDEVFRYPLLWWVGLTPGPPANTVDYVPVFPWFGVALFGVFLGRLFVRYAAGSAFAFWSPKRFIGRLAVGAGRWSLLVYLVHQPLLIGALSLAAPMLVPAGSPDEFMTTCAAQCRTGGRDEAACEGICSCVLDGMQTAGLPIAGDVERMTAVERDQWVSIVRQCVPPAADSPEAGPPVSD